MSPTPVIKLIDATSPDAIKIWADKIYVGLKEIQGMIDLIQAGGGGPVSSEPTGPAGGDLGGTYPDPHVDAITEASGPDSLLIGNVVDGEFLRRVGNTIVSDTISAGGAATLFPPFTVPVDGDFAWVNQGGATTSTSTNDQVCMHIPSSPTASLRIRQKLAPAVPYTITAAFLTNFFSGNYTDTMGMIFTDGTKYQSFGVGYATPTGYYLLSGKWTLPTIYTSNYAARTWIQMSAVLWLQIADDGTNRYCRISSDGTNWLDFNTNPSADFFTVTHVGWAGSTANANAAKLTLVSWEET